jgi:hypothetical protein
MRVKRGGKVKRKAIVFAIFILFSAFAFQVILAERVEIIAPDTVYSLAGSKTEQDGNTKDVTLIVTCPPKDSIFTEIGMEQTKRNTEVNVPVKIKNSVTIGSFGFIISFDPTKLTLLSTERGELLQKKDEQGRYLWQYFEARNVPCTDCGSNKAKYEVVGMYKVGPCDSATHLPLFPQSDYVNLFYLKYLVSPNNIENSFVPISFEWEDAFCWENIFTNPDGNIIYVAKDTILFPNSCLPLSSCISYRRISSFYDGGVFVLPDSFTSVDDDYSDKALPTKSEILSVYPNPFNSSAKISFALEKESDVVLKIYNIKGELVRTLVAEKMSAGKKEVFWDGKGEKGETLSSGVYFCKIQTQDFSESRKMILLK